MRLGGAIEGSGCRVWLGLAERLRLHWPRVLFVFPAYKSAAAATRPRDHLGGTPSRARFRPPIRGYPFGGRAAASPRVASSYRRLGCGARRNPRSRDRRGNPLIGMGSGAPLESFPSPAWYRADPGISPARLTRACRGQLTCRGRSLYICCTLRRQIRAADRSRICEGQGAGRFSVHFDRSCPEAGALARAPATRAPC